MRIYAFQGLRYAPGAGDGHRLAAPPFDQIDDRLRDQLHASSPYQFAHLTRPVPGPEGDPYRHAAELHRHWLKEGILQTDSRPALYPYTIELAGGGRRLGLCALVGLEDPAAHVIRPHEKTLEKPVADRLALLRATRVDLEPILLLSDDGGDLERLLAADLAAAALLAEHRDGAGNRHVLSRIDDAGRIRQYQEALAPRVAAIADGHHRYQVAWRFAQEIGAEAGTPAAAKLAVVSSLASEALTIDPIHRAITEPVDLASAKSLVTSRAPWRGSSGEDLAQEVARAPQPALGVWVAGREPEIWQLDAKQAPGNLSPDRAGLTVAYLHEILLPRLGLSPAATTDGTVLYRSDPNRLYEMTRSGEAAVGFWLPPMEPAAFAAAIAQGELLPPKSTRFLPKVASGLVWAGHDSQIG